MAKFCGRCGSPLDGNTGLCPNCHPAKTTKKSKKPLVIVLVIAAIIAILGGVIGFILVYSSENYQKNTDSSTSDSVAADSSDDSFTDVDNPVYTNSVIVYSEGNSYYVNGGGNILLLKDDSFCSVKERIGDSQYTVLEDIVSSSSAWDSKTLYAECENDYSNLYKFTFCDDGVVEKSVWVSNEVLDNSVVAGDLGAYVGSMNDWSVCGDYIYFVCGYSIFYTQNDIAYQLGRISLEGDKIEFLGETASSYAINNGWIYFYDNGFTYDETDKYNYSIDDDRAGIYKMKLDGTRKQLISNDFENDPESKNDRNELCTKLKIIGGDLYFIDNSMNGQGRVCKMKLDGSDMQYLTKYSATSYTIDVDRDVLYHTTYDSDHSLGSYDLYKISLDTDSEEIMVDYYVYAMDPELLYLNDCVYIQDEDYRLEIDHTHLCGMRYNIINDTIEKLKGKVVEDTVLDDSDIADYDVAVNGFKEKYYWEES